MFKFIVAGITQLEMIIKTKGLPVAYEPFTDAHDGLHMSAGGDAFNESLALKWLGDEVAFMTVVGRSQNLDIFNPPGREVTLDTDYVLPILNETPMEVLLYDDQRNQQVFDDLKDIRDANYDMTLAEPISKDADMFVLSNANFCRPFIDLAKRRDKKIAVKIHNFVREKEKYNVDFLENANILYFSDTSINEDPFDFVQSIADAYNTDIIILGQGAKGVILYDRYRKIKVHYDPVKSGKVVNMAGEGNAVFACFLHYFLKTEDPKMAIHKALLFGSHKIGYLGTSDGFMTEAQLDQWDNLIWNPSGGGALNNFVINGWNFNI